MIYEQMDFPCLAAALRFIISCLRLSTDGFSQI